MLGGIRREREREKMKETGGRWRKKKGLDGWGGRSVIKMRAEERSTCEISREMCAYKGLGLCVERMRFSRCV